MLKNFIVELKEIQEPVDVKVFINGDIVGLVKSINVVENFNTDSKSNVSATINIERYICLGGKSLSILLKPERLKLEIQYSQSDTVFATLTIIDPKKLSLTRYVSVSDGNMPIERMELTSKSVKFDVVE